MDPMESRAFITALQSAMSSGGRVDRTEVIGDFQISYEFSPSPEVDMRITSRASAAPDEQTAMILYNPASAPAASYPAELPFLAGEPVSVWDPSGAPAGTRHATWGSVSDARAAEAQLLEQSTSAGWESEAPPALDPSLPFRMLVLRRDSWTRTVTSADHGAGSMITVMDTVDDPDEAA